MKEWRGIEEAKRIRKTETNREGDKEVNGEKREGKIHVRGQRKKKTTKTNR